MPMAKSAPQAPVKDPEYTAEETKQLAAYIASLGPGPAIPDDEYTDISGKTAKQISEGGEFFRTNCTACHNSVGAGGALPGGKYAPKLDGVSAKHIAEAMITGPQQMPVFSDDVITPEDKSNIIAYIKAGAGPAQLRRHGRWRPRPGVRRPVHLDHRHRRPADRGVWIGAHGARVKKK